MRLKLYWNLLTGKSNAIKPATLSFANIRAVIQAYFRRAKTVAGFELANHLYEQIIWRRTQVISLSPECWSNDECRVCGCDILGKTMEDRACSGTEVGTSCYPEMMSEKEWSAYKKSNNIKLFN